MAFKKTITIFAHSWRQGGFCVAGKEFIEAGQFGPWIRPVNSGSNEAMTWTNLHFGNKQYADVLDVVEFTFDQRCKNLHQTENCLVTEDRPVLKGRIKKSDLPKALDAPPKFLWENGSSSYLGENDQVPEHNLKNFNRSLYLLALPNIKIGVVRNYRGDKALRAEFDIGTSRYNLGITDPAFSGKHSGKRIGEDFTVADAVVCISLSQVFRGNGYKLVAAVFA